MNIRRVLLIIATILASLLIVFYLNNEKYEKNIPPGKMLNYQGINFYFLKETKQIDNKYLELLGSVKNELDTFPKSPFESYDISIGTEFFGVKKEYYFNDTNYKGVIIIKASNSEILVGHPYFRSKRDKAEIKEWFKKFD